VTRLQSTTCESCNLDESPPSTYTKEKYSGIYEELAPSKEPAVEVEAVAVDEVQPAVVPSEKRWGAILDSTCSKDKGFDYGGCVLAY
jgi:hypothetical protein